jgi:hypothetical protein
MSVDDEQVGMVVGERSEVGGSVSRDRYPDRSESWGQGHLDSHVSGTRRVWCAVARHDDSMGVVIDAVVVIAEDPVKLTMGLSGVIDTAFLGGAFVGVAVMGFALFSVAIHPMELRMGLLCFVSGLLSIDIGVGHEEVQLLEVPVGVLK